MTEEVPLHIARPEFPELPPTYFYNYERAENMVFINRFTGAEDAIPNSHHEPKSYCAAQIMLEGDGEFMVGPVRSKGYREIYLDIGEFSKFAKRVSSAELKSEIIKLVTLDRMNS